MTNTDRTETHDPRCARELRLRLLVEAGSPTTPSVRLLHDIATQISHHCGHNLLKSHRLAWGHTVQEAVDAVHALCADHHLGSRGLAHRLWTRWEAGERPGSDYQDMLCRLFCTRPDRLGFGTDYSHTLPAIAPAALPAPAYHPCAPSQASPSSEGELASRTAHTAAHTPPTAEPADGYLDTIERLVTMAADGSARFGDHPSNVGPLTLDQLRTDAQELARSLVNGQRLVIFDRAVRLRDRIFALLDGRQRIAESRELYFLAAASLGMLAEASTCLGFHSQAMTHTRTGLLCAQEAGHPDLTAWLFGMQSLIAWDARWYGQAVDYAQRGQQESAKGTITVWLPAHAARAAAQLGDHTTTRAALDQARQAWDHVDRDVLDTDYGGFLTFTPVKETYYASCGWLALGDAQQARATAEAAIRGFQEGPPEARAYDCESIAQLTIATAYVLDGDLDAAAVPLEAALALPPELRTTGLGTGLRRLHQLASRPTYAGSPQATEMRDRIEDFLATTAPTVSGS
jgi:hypothetical protein